MALDEAGLPIRGRSENSPIFLVRHLLTWSRAHKLGFDVAAGMRELDPKGGFDEINLARLKGGIRDLGTHLEFKGVDKSNGKQITNKVAVPSNTNEAIADAMMVGVAWLARTVGVRPAALRSGSRMGTNTGIPLISESAGNDGSISIVTGIRGAAGRSRTLAFCVGHPREMSHGRVKEAALSMMKEVVADETKNRTLGISTDMIRWRFRWAKEREQIMLSLGHRPAPNSGMRFR